MTQPLDHIVVVFRNDDISALSDVEHERRVAAIFEQYGIPQTLGVIPLCAADSIHNTRGQRVTPLASNQDMVFLLRDYVGRSRSEIALHGNTHRTNRLSRPRRREYFEFKLISLEEQERRIRRGTEIICQALNIIPHIFIPPWNRFDLNTLLACKKNNYKIVSAGLFTPVLDGLISFGANCDIENFPSILRHVEGSKSRVFLCVNYHSEKIRRQWEFELLKKAVSLAADTSGCEAVTMTEAIRRYPDEIRLLNEAGRNIASQETVFDPMRGRAMIYRKTFSFLPQRKNLNSAYKKAKESYYQGMYDEVCKLSPSIDRESKNLILMSRGIASLIGFFFSILFFSLISWITPVNEMLSWAMTLLIFTVFWIGIWWYATSPDTRREIRFAGLLSLMSGGIGMILFYFLRHFLY
jgi:hypothetical protein